MSVPSAPKTGPNVERQGDGLHRGRHEGLQRLGYARGYEPRLPQAFGAQGLILHAVARNGYNNDQEVRQGHLATVIWELSVYRGPGHSVREPEWRSKR